jgi:hypothetical protein
VCLEGVLNVENVARTYNYTLNRMALPLGANGGIEVFGVLEEAEAS